MVVAFATKIASYDLFTFATIAARTLLTVGAVEGDKTVQKASDVLRLIGTKVVMCLALLGSRPSPTKIALIYSSLQRLNVVATLYLGNIPPFVSSSSQLIPAN